VCVADKGDLFGWGNTEYGQLSGGQDSSEMQVNLPRHLPFTNTTTATTVSGSSVVGKVVKVAAAGSSCALINGNSRLLIFSHYNPGIEFPILGSWIKKFVVLESRDPVSRLGLQIDSYFSIHGGPIRKFYLNCRE